MEKSKKKDGNQYIKLIFQLNINFVSIDDDLADLAIKEAQKKDITHYDGVHIALSKREQTTLVTQDK